MNTTTTTIFVAEVASTFNEQLLTRHMLENAKDDRLKAYLINNEIDSIRGTIIRQTMFAEFEKISHAMAEAGEPLTVDALKNNLRKTTGRFTLVLTSASTKSCRWNA